MLSAQATLLVAVLLLSAGLAAAQTSNDSSTIPPTTLPDGVVVYINWNDTANITTEVANKLTGIKLQPGQIWAWCGWPGKQNLKFKFNATKKGYFSISSPSQVQACDPSQASKCGVLDTNNGGTFDNKSSGNGTSWGYISGVEKCMMFINSYQEVNVTINVSANSTSMGNQAAIDFGVAIVTIVIFSLGALMCFFDAKKLYTDLKRVPKVHTRSSKPDRVYTVTEGELDAAAGVAPRDVFAASHLSLDATSASKSVHTAPAEAPRKSPWAAFAAKLKR